MIFVNVAIWRETQNIQLIAIANMCYLFFHMLFHSVSYNFIIKWREKWVRRLWYLAYIALYIVLISFPQHIYEHTLIVFAFVWIANGMYYSTYNLQQFHLTNFWNRGHFEGIKKSVKMWQKVLYPFLYGVIIAFSTIQIGLTIGICFFILSWYVWGVDKVIPESQAKIKHFFKLTLKNKKVFLSYIAIIWFTFSFSVTLFDVLIPLLLSDRVEGDLELWGFLSLISIVSMFGLYILWKFLDYKHYNRAMTLIIVLYIIALWLLTYVESILLVSLVSSTIRVLLAAFWICASVISYNVLLDIKQGGKYKAEHTIIREIFQTIWWLLGYCVLYLSPNIGTDGLSLFIYTMICMTLLTWITFSRINIHKITETT
jgi:YQGE family putative transporter